MDMTGVVKLLSGSAADLFELHVYTFLAMSIYMVPCATLWMLALDCKLPPRDRCLGG